MHTPQFTPWIATSTQPAAVRVAARLRAHWARAGAVLAVAGAAMLGGNAVAAPEGVSTGGCEVLASGQLGSSEYIASYQGACQGGKAQGQGKAVWRLRYSPQAAPVVWQGRFDQGVFLAEREVKGARRVDSTRVLLDLGALNGPGGAAGQMWVEGRVDGKLPAQACKPLSLQVGTTGALADDAVAKQWLNAAYQRWLAVCGATVVQAHSGRNLRVQLREGKDWAPDANGNLGAGVVQAVTPFVAQAQATNWQQYTNRAAQQQAHAAREQASNEAARAGRERLLAFARTHGAQQFANLASLEQNPFRFGEQVLLVAVQMTEARTPSEGVVRNANRGGRDCCTRALVHGDIRTWDAQSRLLAVRVKGRKTDSRATEVLLLDVLGSHACTEADCADVLRGPQGWLKEGAL